jgi:hypothetical protein
MAFCASAMNLGARERLLLAGAASSSRVRLLPPRREARVWGPEGAASAASFPSSALAEALVAPEAPPAPAASAAPAFLTAAATAPRRAVLPFLKLLTCQGKGREIHTQDTAEPRSKPRLAELGDAQSRPHNA